MKRIQRSTTNLLLTTAAATVTSSLLAASPVQSQASGAFDGGGNSGDGPTLIVDPFGPLAPDCDGPQTVNSGQTNATGATVTIAVGKGERRPKVPSATGDSNVDAQGTDSASFGDFGSGSFDGVPVAPFSSESGLNHVDSGNVDATGVVLAPAYGRGGERPKVPSATGDSSFDAQGADSVSFGDLGSGSGDGVPFAPYSSGSGLKHVDSGNLDATGVVLAPAYGRGGERPKVPTAAGDPTQNATGSTSSGSGILGDGTGGPSTPGGSAEPAGPTGFGNAQGDDILDDDRLEISVMLSSGLSVSIHNLSNVDAAGEFLIEGLTFREGGETRREVTSANLDTTAGAQLVHIEGDHYAGYDAAGELMADVMLWYHPRLSNSSAQRWTGRAMYLDGSVTQFSLLASGDFADSGIALQAIEQLWATHDQAFDSNDPMHPILPVSCYRMLMACEGNGEVVIAGGGLLGLTLPCHVVCDDAPNGGVGASSF